MERKAGANDGVWKCLQKTCEQNLILCLGQWEEEILLPVVEC